MLIRPYKVSDVRDYFVGAKNHEYAMTTDKTGVKCIELIGASFLADEAAIFGEPNIEYIKKEIDWYQSQSLNIKDIYGPERRPPEAWEYAASPEGFINSNYGHLIWSEENGYQYDNVLAELKAGNVKGLLEQIVSGIHELNTTLPAMIANLPGGGGEGGSSRPARALDNSTDISPIMTQRNMNRMV